MPHPSRRQSSGHPHPWRANEGRGDVGRGEEDEDREGEGPQPSAFIPAPEPPVGVIEPFTAWRRGLRGHLQRQVPAAQVSQLDLSTMEMEGTEWSWFCQSVLPTMSSLTSLKLAQVGLTDKRLAELLRECQSPQVRCSTRSSCLRRLTVPVVSRSGASVSQVSPDIVTSSPACVGRGSRSRSATDVSGLVVNGKMPVTSANIEDRQALRRLKVLDLSKNRLTYRSATPLGKLLLWAANDLDELHLQGNCLQDYGFQILGIYLSKLQMDVLNKERHLFPPSLVQQYVNLAKDTKRNILESRPQHTVHRESFSTVVREGDRSSVVEQMSNQCKGQQIHLGISFLDLRDCHASARGISEVLAGASCAYQLKTLLLSHNCAIPPSLMLLKSPYVDEESGPVTADVIGVEENFTDPNTLTGTAKFSSFKELQYPCALTNVNFSGVPFSQLCTPIGCRELFLNLLFCCPKLLILDLSESFDRSQLPSSLLLHAVLEGTDSRNDSRISWRLQQEIQGDVEFALETVMIGRQTSVGNILCELLAHAAFNACRRCNMAPPAFCYLQELYLNDTGINDRGAQGLAIAVQSSTSTGVLARLMVLNMSQNLLSVWGCIQIVQAFILNWSSPPSVLSALALQGNAGIRHGDKNAIEELRHIAELAVRRRREECNTEMYGSEKQPLLPLSIHLGAFEDSTFTVASDEMAVFTFSPEKGEHSSSRENKMSGKVEKHVCNEGREVEEDEQDNTYFPTFRLAPGGAIPFVQTTTRRSFTEVPASTSFHSALITNKGDTQPSAPCDVSSIHARETPQRFLSSMPETPSFLQNTGDVPFSPEGMIGRHQQQEQVRRRNNSTRLVSPALDTESTSRGGKIVTFATEEETQGDIAVGGKSANLLSLSHSSSVVPLKVAKSEDLWAMAVASARARSYTADQDVSMRSKIKELEEEKGQLQHPQNQQKQKQEGQQQNTHLPIESLTHLNGGTSHPSLAFSFGSLFASIDAKKPCNDMLPGETTTSQDHLHQSVDTDETRRISDKADSFISYTTKGTNTGEALEGVSSLQDKNSIPATFEALRTAKDATIDIAMGEMNGTNTDKRRVQKHPHGECPNAMEGPLIKPITDNISKNDNTASCFGMSVSMQIANEVEQYDMQDSKQGLQKGEKRYDSEAVSVTVRHPQGGDTEGMRSEEAFLRETVKKRKLRSFVLTYYHPKGHVLCRGWQLLHCSDPVGEEARACLERDIWMLLQPSFEERGQLEVRDVSLLMTPPSKENGNRVIEEDNDDEKSQNNCSNGSDCATTGANIYHGATRVQVTTNERRSVLADRLLLMANAYDGYIAFPIFTAALQRAAADTVEIVRALLDSAWNVLPDVYRNSSAEALVHSRHDHEEHLMRELGIFLEMSLEQTGDVNHFDQVVKENEKGSKEEEKEQQHEWKKEEQEEVRGGMGCTARGMPVGGAEVDAPSRGSDVAKSYSSCIDTGDVVVPSNLDTPGQRDEDADREAQQIEESVDEGQHQEVDINEVKEADEKCEDFNASGCVPGGNVNVVTQTSLPTPGVPVTVPKSHIVTDNALAQPIQSSTAVAERKEGEVAPVTRPLAGRMKTFVFSFLHREGHAICRGWRILHREDFLGEKARGRLEEDLLSFLNLPSLEKANDTSGDGGRLTSNDSNGGNAQMYVVELVSLIREPTSSTMQLRVMTNGRRTVISERLQSILKGDLEVLPRFAELLRSNELHDTVHVVQLYLQQRAPKELLARVANRYRTLSAFVHYYHSDEAAMLREIGASSMLDVEAVVVPTSAITEPEDDNNSSNNNNDIVEKNTFPNEESTEVGKDNTTKEETEEKRDTNAEVAEEKNAAPEPVPLDRIERTPDNDASQRALLNNTAALSSAASEIRKEDRVREVTPVTLHSRSSSLSLRALEESQQGVGTTQSRSASHREENINSRTTINNHNNNPNPNPNPNRHHYYNSNTNSTSNRNVSTNENNNNKGSELVTRDGGAYAEKLRRFQFLAYSAVTHGAILLDKQQRHKVRICKGRWGKQRVTISVEWDVFLVVWFVKKLTFGLSTLKSLVLVHPIASGVRCSVGDDHTSGGQRHVVHICVERSYTPEELGVSLEEMEQRVQEALTASSGKHDNTPRARNLSSQRQEPRCHQHSPGNNSSIASSFSSVDTVNALATVPSKAQLLQRVISIHVALSSASKARETVNAICNAEKRAAEMLR